MSILDLTKAQILAATQPEDIFSKSTFSTDSVRLRKRWHPDHGGDNEVSSKLTALIEIGRQRIKDKTWGGKDLLVVTTHDDRTFNFKYKKHHSFELGDMYIGENNVAFVVRPEFKDLYENAIKSIKSIRFPNKKFESEFKKYIPSIVFSSELNSKSFFLVLTKTPQSVLLSDFIEFMPDNKIDPKQAAWVMGSHYNQSAFFETIGIMQGGFTPSGVLIDPENHICYPVSWWYTTKVEQKLTALPGSLLRVLPRAVLKEKKAKSSFDRLALKAIGIFCLGDKTMVGSKLLMDKSVPSDIVSWVRGPSPDSAVKEYSLWDKVLKKTFGKRKFVKIDVTSSQIYK